MRTNFIKKIVPVLVLVLTPLLTTMPVSAGADTCIWTGAVDGSISNAANWSVCDNGAQPEAGDRLEFPAGATTTTLIWNSALDFEQITFSGNGYIVNPGSSPVTTDFLFFTGDNNIINSNVSIISNGGGMGWFVNGINNEIVGDVALNNGAGSNMDTETRTLFEISGDISGTVNSITHVGATGAMTLSGANTFVSSVLVTSGTINCDSATCFGNAANIVREQGISTTGKFRFISSQTIANGIDLFSATNNNALEIADGVTLTHTGFLALSINAAVNVQVGSGSSYISTATIATSNPAQRINFVGENTTASIVRLNGTTNTTAGSEITVENATLNVGSGTTTNLNGVMRAKTNSVLSTTGNNALGSMTGNTILENGARLAVNDVTASLEENITISGSGTISRSAGAGQDVGVGRNITLAGDLTLDAGNTTGDMILYGIISGTGNITASNTSSGPGRIVMSSSAGNTYVGNFTVAGSNVTTTEADQTQVTGNLILNSGTFSNGVTNTLADNSSVRVESGGTFIVAAPDTIGSLAGTGVLSLNSNLTIAGSANTVFSGIINGAGSLIHSGSGTLELTPSNGSANPGTATLNVASGTVTSNTNLIKFITSISGGTLKGTGVFGSTTMTSGAFAPGNSPGCNTVDGSLNLNGGSFTVELNGNTVCSQYDKTTVTGVVNISGATLDVALGFTPAAGDVFTIIDGTTLTGTFAGLADGATLGINGSNFRVNYTSGGNVTLTVLASSSPTKASTLSNTGASVLASIFTGFGLLFLTALVTPLRKI